MKRYAVHVCLVSHQLLPNLLLCCDDTSKPELVVLLETTVMHNKSQLLSKLIKQQGCSVEIVNVNSYDVSVIQQLMGNLLNRFSAEIVAVNVTGGNKLMAMAAFLESWSRNVTTFYVDTDTDTIWQLGEPSQQFPLPDIFKVNLYLQAYGYRILATGEQSLFPELAQLANELTDDLNCWGGAIKTLNYYANKAEYSLNTQLAERDLANQNFIQLLDKMATTKLLCRDGVRLVFADEKARFFANGGWLEHHVLGVVQKLRQDDRIRDVFMNVTLADESGAKNEIDVLFTSRNRLFMIECKTKNMQTDRARVDDMIYKLESLKGLIGGLYGRTMLLSYFPISNADQTRCSSYGLTVVDGRKLKDLRSVLCKWILDN